MNDGENIHPRRMGRKNRNVSTRQGRVLNMIKVGVEIPQDKPVCHASDKTQRQDQKTTRENGILHTSGTDGGGTLFLDSSGTMAANEGGGGDKILLEGEEGGGDISLESLASRTLPLIDFSRDTMGGEGTSG